MLELMQKERASFSRLSHSGGIDRLIADAIAKTGQEAP